LSIRLEVTMSDQLRPSIFPAVRYREGNLWSFGTYDPYAPAAS
jgi:hypothetical protein